jgi:hypothetical protein
MVGENDLPALPQSFHDASDAFADVDADAFADVEADVEADVADVSTHGGGDFGGDFGEGFEAPVDVAPPPGFQDSNAEHTPATDASAIALAALQAALHADRAAHSQAARAMSAASADTHAMKRAEAKIHAVETKIHAAMDERLALLERCFADRIENLRKAVETGDAEREVLRGRVETLEATLATKEGRRDASSGVPVYSCPPLDPGEYLGHPSSPPPAPRGTRPPPVVIDVEDVPCPPFQGSAVTSAVTRTRGRPGSQGRRRRRDAGRRRHGDPHGDDGRGRRRGVVLPLRGWRRRRVRGYTRRVSVRAGEGRHRDAGGARQEPV